jgi:hypothetical protein
MSRELAAAAAFAACAVLGWLVARWIDRHRVRPRAGRSLAILVLAALVGAGAGYGAGEYMDADDPVLAAAAGAGAGLLLGAALLLLWRRAHPRVRGPGGAYALTGIPATRLEEVDGDSAHALLGRWLAFASGSLVRIAIVPASAALEPLAADVAGRLQRLHLETARHAATAENGAAGEQELPVPTAEAGAAEGGSDWRSRWWREPGGEAAAETSPPAQVRPSAPDPAEPIVTMTSGPPGAETLGSDVVVLLAADRMSHKELAETTRELDRLGRRPEWILLADRRGRRREPSQAESPRGDNGGPPQG